ncbi:hypothetical protein MAR_037250 [Mya arenaria]|uniref:Uncharacterized protein n=1 Tax=Mya arenaria TaxID=6604 RepID=A0ABY7FMS5_MYAAR|nr:hypothetical protein MAR_037199 [Mya arenaria]WAR23581.1 hypothetical protein MAR_037250 [Mya arenaria]
MYFIHRRNVSMFSLKNISVNNCGSEKNSSGEKHSSREDGLELQTTSQLRSKLTASQKLDPFHSFKKWTTVNLVNLIQTLTRTTEDDSILKERLQDLHKALRDPIPDKPTAKFITDRAQALVEQLNQKRKNDTASVVERIQQQLYAAYSTQSALVDQKLHELFTCLDDISVTEAELENFKKSLRNLYQEIYSHGSPSKS